jgi:hypothetical protein
MGKNHSKKKKGKPFNPIRNGKKLQKLRPKHRKLESDNSGRNPKSSPSPSEEKEKRMFSEEDQKMMLHIKSILSQNGKTPEYHKESNAITYAIKKKSNIYPLFIDCQNSVLRIRSLRSIGAINGSEDVLKYILDLNFRMLMGGFCYIMEKDCIVYKLSIPLYEKPAKGFVASLIVYSIDILEDQIPEILLQIHETPRWKKEDRSPTFH